MDDDGVRLSIAPGGDGAVPGKAVAASGTGAGNVAKTI